MSGLSVKRMLVFFWSPFVESFFSIWLHVHANSICCWRHLPICIHGYGQFHTDTLAHLRSKRILSCWFCNKRMRLETRIYGTQLYYRMEEISFFNSHRCWYTVYGADRSPTNCHNRGQLDFSLLVNLMRKVKAKSYGDHMDSLTLGVAQCNILD